MKGEEETQRTHTGGGFPDSLHPGETPILRLTHIKTGFPDSLHPGETPILRLTHIKTGFPDPPLPRKETQRTHTGAGFPGSLLPRETSQGNQMLEKRRTALNVTKRAATLPPPSQRKLMRPSSLRVPLIKEHYLGVGWYESHEITLRHRGRGSDDRRQR